MDAPLSEREYDLIQALKGLTKAVRDLEGHWYSASAEAGKKRDRVHYANQHAERVLKRIEPPTPRKKLA